MLFNPSFSFNFLDAPNLSVIDSVSLATEAIDLEDMQGTDGAEAGSGHKGSGPWSATQEGSDSVRHPNYHCLVVPTVSSLL
jgi:hypothetical protein